MVLNIHRKACSLTEPWAEWCWPWSLYARCFIKVSCLPSQQLLHEFFHSFQHSAKAIEMRLSEPPPPKKLWALGEATVCCGFFSFSYFLFCFFAVPWGKEWLFYLAEKTLHVDLHLSLRVSCLRQRNILSLVDKGHAEYSWNSDSSQNYVWWGKQILLICPERWTSYISVVSC